VALATTSITGSLVFGGEKRGAKLGQDESSSSDVLEQDETGFGCDGVYERMQEKRADSAWRVHSQGLPMMLLCSCCCS